jgi:putative exosortase-associated protein (TIGR04073 family)
MKWTRFRILTAVAAFALSGLGASAQTTNPLNRGFVATELYLWNRLADLCEIFDAGVAVGPAIGAEVSATQYLQLGAYTAKETGASFPHFLPPLWLVTHFDDEPIFTKHEGRYSTRCFGPRRVESSQLRDLRFPRSPWDIRLQLGLGLGQVYGRIKLLEVGDFITGFVGLDLAKDDKVLSPTITRNPARQLGRGISNVVTGLWEIPTNMIETTNSDGHLAGITTGLFRGIYRGLARELTGVVEIITFPMGWEPVIEPEFMFTGDNYPPWSVNPLPFQRDY